MHLIYRKTCRVCGSSALIPVIDLGDQHLQGSFIKPGYIAPPMRKLPTQLVRCDVTRNETACGLLQMAHTVPPEILYANYWYRSGTNRTMRQHLKDVVAAALDLIPRAGRVLDIGCNDGFLLSCYPAGVERFGVDPSDIAREIPPPVTVVNGLFPSEVAFRTFGDRNFDIVTSVAMFYDLESPITFAAAVKRCLAANGVWVLEMAYLPLMLERNSFDTICHEHLEYYSLAVLEYIMKQAGLRIFKADLNEINGGSIRCFVTHADNVRFGKQEDQSFLYRLRIHEFELELDTDKPYLAFQERIRRLKTELRALLTGIRAAGERIHVYGASTKGNVLLQWYEIDHTVIECAADRNPAKDGARTLGTGIPIVTEEKSRALRPDYYLVLPWHFKREFLKRERATLDAGTRMIFPLPEITVVDAGTVDAELAGEDLPSGSLAG